MQTTLASDADILKRIEAFCSAQEMSLTGFGRASIGDGNLVSNLKADRSLTLKTAARVVRFMETYRPADQTSLVA